MHRNKKNLRKIGEREYYRCIKKHGYMCYMREKGKIEKMIIKNLKREMVNNG